MVLPKSKQTSELISIIHTIHNNSEKRNGRIDEIIKNIGSMDGSLGYYRGGDKYNVKPCLKYMFKKLPTDVKNIITDMFDFRNEDLTGQDLSHGDFAGCNFQGQDLSTTDFSFADLRGANLSYIKGPRVYFDGHHIEIGFSFANLEGANLNSSELNHTLFWYANMKNATLCYAILDSAYLSRTNLENAIMRWCQLYRTFMPKCILKNTDMRNAMLWNPLIHNARIDDINLQGAHIKVSKRVIKRHGAIRKAIKK